jgi:hypothetical protein
LVLLFFQNLLIIHSTLTHYFEFVIATLFMEIALIADDMGLGKTIQVRPTRTDGFFPVKFIFVTSLSTHILHCTFNVPYQPFYST